jgi:magnesium-transporting ATPase (P-type)
VPADGFMIYYLLFIVYCVLLIVPADGAVLQVNDLLVSQHELTGEAALTPKGPRRGQGGDRRGGGGGGGEGGWAAGWVGAGGEVWWASPAVFAGTYVEFGEARMVCLDIFMYV